MVVVVAQVLLRIDYRTRAGYRAKTVCRSIKPAPAAGLPIEVTRIRD